MFGKYKVAHLIGITREHEKEFRYVEAQLTKMGYICFAPVIYDYDIYKEYSELIDDMCYEKLLISDICVIVTPEHIGKSTQLRIKQAKELNKPVYMLENNILSLYKEASLRAFRSPHNTLNVVIQNCSNEVTTFLSRFDIWKSGGKFEYNTLNKKENPTIWFECPIEFLEFIKSDMGKECFKRMGINEFQLED